jgi:F0F1-type ATP synthase assembly protein I
MALKRKLARKAVKTTAKHSAHGTVAKLKRDPARAGTLLGAGALIGLVVGWLAGRSGGGHTPAEAPAP